MTKAELQKQLDEAVTTVVAKDAELIEMRKQLGLAEDQFTRLRDIYNNLFEQSRSDQKVIEELSGKLRACESSMSIWKDQACMVGPLELRNDSLRQAVRVLAIELAIETGEVDALS